MIYFDYLSNEQKDRMFYISPAELSADRETLAHALGALLYMPATSKAVEKLLNNQIPGLISTVLCLEDAVDDREVDSAEKNLALQLKNLLFLRESGSCLPLIFVRVRSVEQLERLAKNLGPALYALSGFVFPKFDAAAGAEYFGHLAAINGQIGKTLYGMPILEGPEAIYLESRTENLLSIKELLDQYKDLVLNVRMGATDLSGLYGLRRSPELTVYDIGVLQDFIADVVNIFGRPRDGYIISGPVWEYFSTGSRILKPQLRQTPFKEKFGEEGRRVRHELICRYIDGLIREVMLDKANGLIGKTVIHPSHILPVQALHAVTHEEYCDARDILENGGSGGVKKSVYNNKMNEPKPHYNWARRIKTLSRIYGVLNERYDYTSIICEGEQLQSIG